MTGKELPIYSQPGLNIVSLQIWTSSNNVVAV